MKRVCNHHSELQFNCEVIFSLNLQKLLLETFMYATIRFALCSRLHDDNLRTSPKHIVFLSKLLLLFQICHTSAGQTIRSLKLVKLEPWQWSPAGAKTQNAPKRRMCGIANLTCLARKLLLEISCFVLPYSCQEDLQARFFRSSNIWVWLAFPCVHSSTTNV